MRGALLAPLVLLTLNLTACSTIDRKGEKTVVGNVGVATGQWVGSADIRNLKTAKSGSIEFEAIAREPAQLHLEATGPFGVNVASIVINGTKFQALLPREKKFIEGKTSADSIARVIPIRLSPALLIAVFFDRPVPAPWVCEVTPPTSSDQPPGTFCKDAAHASTLGRTNAKDGKRVIVFMSPDASVTMIVKEAKSKVQFNDQAFTLQAPAGFRKEMF